MENTKAKKIILTTLIVLILSIIGVTVFMFFNKEKSLSNVSPETKNENFVEKTEIQKTTVPENYIGIYTVEDYKKFFTGEYLLTDNYILMNDLDLSSVENITSIGYRIDEYYTPSFSGVFDGNYHKIYNFNLNVSENEMEGGVGFFARTDGAIIKNLTIENSKITSNVKTYKIGILVGGIENSKVDNCNIQGTIELNGKQSAGRVGFIAGEVTGISTVSGVDINKEYATIITNCEVNGKIIGNNSYEYGNSIGGAFGQISDGMTLGTKAEKIVVNLEIDSDNLNGSGFASVCSADIIKCGANVNIKTKSENGIAGFISYAKNAYISECYSKGNITANSYVAGFIRTTDTLGYTGGYLIKNSYSNVNITLLENPNYNTSAVFIDTAKDAMENVYGIGNITYENKVNLDKYFIKTLKSVPNGIYYNKEENKVEKGYEKYYIGLTLEEMKLKSSYANFDFNNVWQIDEGKTTPYLKWEKEI